MHLTAFSWLQRKFLIVKESHIHMYIYFRASERSGGSRGGAQGARPPPLFWVKKEEMTEGKMAAMASKSRPGSPPPLAQGLDPPLERVY